MSEEASLRHAVLVAARQLGPRGLAVGTAGNVSARFGDGMLITPSGHAYEDIDAAAIVHMRLDGQVHGALMPSSEWRMHAALYADRPETQGVVHTHSSHATALACLRRGIPPFHYMVAVAGGNDIRCAGYATFGTEALSHAMLSAMAGRRACLLANHGTIALGRDVARALDLASEVEELAKLYLLALGVGEPVLLSDEQMAEAHAKFAGYGALAEPGAPSAVTGISRA